MKDCICGHPHENEGHCPFDGCCCTEFNEAGPIFKKFPRAWRKFITDPTPAAIKASKSFMFRLTWRGGIYHKFLFWLNYVILPKFGKAGAFGSPMLNHKKLKLGKEPGVGGFPPKT